MNTLLRSGLAGRSFKATLKVYLLNAALIGTTAMAVSCVADVDTAFASIPYLAIGIVLVEYAIARGVFSRLLHSAQQPHQPPVLIEEALSTPERWSTGLYIIELFKCIAKGKHEGLTRGERTRLAANAFKRMVSGRGDSALDRGVAMFSIGQYDKALAYLDHAPDNARTWLTRGLALSGAQRHYEAIDAYNKGIALKPWIPDGYLNRGTAQAKIAWDELLSTQDEEGVKTALEGFLQARESFKRGLSKFLDDDVSRTKALSSLQSAEEKIRMLSALLEDRLDDLRPEELQEIEVLGLKAKVKESAST